MVNGVDAKFFSPFFAPGIWALTSFESTTLANPAQQERLEKGFKKKFRRLALLTRKFPKGFKEGRILPDRHIYKPLFLLIFSGQEKIPARQHYISVTVV
ncbi:MAG: hypothetical protein KDJ67_04055 [Nitratireductor sp.]|nr:hypothetical protein [Nitratireductor sp.]